MAEQPRAQTIASLVPPVRLIAADFSLGLMDLAKFFNTSIENISSWYNWENIAKEHIFHIGDILPLLHQLEHNFSPEQLPVLVRKPMPEQQGQTLLQLLSEEQDISKETLKESILLLISLKNDQTKSNYAKIIS